MARKASSPPSPEPDGIEELRQRLRQVSMTVVACEIDRLLAEAEEEQLSYSDFLARLLDCEQGTRRERKIARRLKRARLGVVKSLDDFDFKARPKLTAAAVKELLGCRFVEEGRSIVCIGRAGTGKTHVAKAIAHAACMKGYSVYAGTTADILDEMHAGLADDTFAKVFRRYSQADLVLLDEVGYLGLDEERSSHLFRLVSARHPNRAMVVTTNTAFEDWKKFFPNEAQAVATVDRLIDRATVLRFTGKSFRKPRDLLGGPLD